MRGSMRGTWRDRAAAADWDHVKRYTLGLVFHDAA